MGNTPKSRIHLKKEIAFPKAHITTGFEIGTGSGKCLAGSVTSNRQVINSTMLDKY